MANMPHPAPTVPGQRIEAIDVIRGFALLGILLMNILAFGLPFRAYFDPTVDGAVSGVDFGVYFTVELFAEGVMRALFSMLFGAGVVILATGERAKSAGVYYRRQLLLLAFGLVDAFVLLWTGDILVAYALAGLVLYPLRNWQPKALFATAALAFVYLALFYAAMFAMLKWVPDQAGLTASFHPPPEALAREALKFEGSYSQSFFINAGDVLGLYAVYPLFLLWDALACMVLGMALYKTGVLRGQRSVRFYAHLAAWGLGIGLAVNGFELLMKISSGFAVQWVSGVSTVTNDIGRVSMAIGFLSLIAIVCSQGWLGSARRALAAVGRMALSNYILQSVLGLLVFHSLGLALWDQLPRHQLYLVVLGEWIIIAVVSVAWLRRYRFGPLEWLWRSLTYGRPQPMATAA